jgi:hypothetical protein
MIKRNHLALALAGVLALAAPLAAQQDGAPGGRGPGFGRRMLNPVKILVDSAQTLSLTPQQTQDLALVAEQLDSVNAPVVAELQRRRPQGGGGFGGGQPTPEQRAAFEQLRPLMQQLRSNSDAALASAFAVLTPAQQEKARDLLPRRRQAGEGRERGGDGAPPEN